ncbi:uncharacterized protein cnih4 isoform X2 [Syngnathoides biaculeatus]|uniref:uncharacterized protein cnih4 isoform X2 n=1 Tax=Syngnathoides biaculeatus TaxID=300417 RepID=UPI002ADDB834|nr:uncharacterized protein cnih4 isoform X2 [Syngnathoides biaculeatus]
MYVLQTVALKKRQEAKLEVAEMKMLRFSLGVNRLDRIRNELIRDTPRKISDRVQRRIGRIVLKPRTIRRASKRPGICRYVMVPVGNMGVFDPTEIHNRGQLKSHMKEAMIKLGYHLLCFFIYLYSMILALIND